MLPRLAVFRSAPSPGDPNRRRAVPRRSRRAPRPRSARRRSRSGTRSRPPPPTAAGSVAGWIRHDEVERARRPRSQLTRRRRPSRRPPRARAGRSGRCRPSARRGASGAGWASAPRPRSGSAAPARAAARTRRPTARRVARGPRRAAAPARAGRPGRRTARTRRGGRRRCPTPNTSRPPLRRSSVTVSRASFGIRRRGVGRHERADPDALGRTRDRGHRDPRVGELARRRVDEVVPDEEAVPAVRPRPLRRAARAGARLRAPRRVQRRSRAGQPRGDGSGFRGRTSV